MSAFNISIEELQKQLHGSTGTHFSFLKKDGKFRHAFGTLNENLIPEELRPKDSSAHFNGDNLKYFDLEKNAWRSLSKDCSMIEILE